MVLGGSERGLGFYATIFAASPRQFRTLFLKVSLIVKLRIALASAALLAFSFAQTPATPRKTQTATPKTAAPKAQTPAQTTPAAAEGKGTDTVITINGLCAQGTSGANCPPRTISQAEFEKVVQVINPNLPKDSRRQVAGLYIQLLVMADQGQKLGADKDPTFEERMRLERLRLLAQAAERKLQEGTKPVEQDVETFYAENANRFEELAIRRVMVPKAIDGQAKPEETKQLAEQLRQRALQGEEFDKLQAEAFVSTKAPGAPPSTSLGWKRRGAMDMRHEDKVVALRAGQVSELLDDNQYWYFYRIDSKRMIPMATAQKDIENALQQQRMETRIRQVLGGIKPDLSEAYFGPPQAPQQQNQQQQPPAQR